jgi:Xaa-Pro aminopeptidase
MLIEDIQTRLAEQGIDGWLLYDFHRRNQIAYRALHLPDDLIVTRRWYYYIPVKGQPIGLVSALEPHNLDSVPGTKLVYRTWEDRRDALERMLVGAGTVAMEYSPLNAIPYVSLVDAGTIDLIRSLGPTVVSSADLVQTAICQWSEQQWNDHHEASKRLMEIKDRAFAEVTRRIESGASTTDFDIQQLMYEWYRESGLVSDDPPIVATNEHCSDPHYLPAGARQTPIKVGDVLLTDFWAKLDKPGAVYADHTWTAFVGNTVPAQVVRVFSAVAAARDAAIDFVISRFAAAQPIRGWQVDDVARHSIEREGYGDFFIHRTGHNIDEDVHGEGANMDNYETHDERLVLERTCFSIEPGIYLPDFGIRSEVDVFIASPDDVRVTGVPIQRGVSALLRSR